MGKILVGKLSELQEGTMKAVKVEGRDDVVIAKINGKVYAMNGTCGHAGGPLAEGELDGPIITCPWHGAKWDITTGKNTEFAIELDPEPVYRVSTEEDNIYIEI